MPKYCQRIVIFCFILYWVEEVEDGVVLHLFSMH